MSEPAELTAQQLVAHIRKVRETHFKLTGFKPNTVLMTHAHRAELMARSSAAAEFDGQNFTVDGMEIIEDRYAALPRVMFEHRPRVK